MDSLFLDIYMGLKSKVDLKVKRQKEEGGEKVTNSL